MRKLGIIAAFAAAAAWLLDPASGRRRRALLRDRTAGILRRGARRSERFGRHMASDTQGLVQRATHREEPRVLDDATLKNKVETELFRATDSPKGRVSVNAQHGIVQLRGEVDSPDLIEDLVQKTRSIQGVREVENLLHVPGSPAPMHQ
jgi:hyperosmotically inducible periplasmic protein